MCRIRTGYILALSCSTIILLWATNLVAEVAEENKIVAESTLAFTQYCLALKNEDYAEALSLELHYMQKAAGNVENYKKWWMETPDIDEWRKLYDVEKIKKVEILTPKRAVIFIDLPDMRMDTAGFYIVQEDGKWKVGCFEHVFHQTDTELEELKDAIEYYYEKNGRLPKDLSELVPDYIEDLPIDLFNDKGQPYRYVKGEDGNFIIYSFGPDSDDDLGMVKYDYKKGLLSNGDLIVGSQ